MLFKTLKHIVFEAIVDVTIYECSCIKSIVKYVGEFGTKFSIHTIKKKQTKC